jgi:hypothetical protein
MNTPGLPKDVDGGPSHIKLSPELQTAIFSRDENRFKLMEKLEPAELAVALNFELRIQQEAVGGAASIGPAGVATNLDAMVEELEAREEALVKKLIDLAIADSKSGGLKTVEDMARRVGVSEQKAKEALIRGYSLELVKGSTWPNTHMERLGLKPDEDLIEARKREAARARLDAYPDTPEKLQLFQALDNDYDAGRITREELVPLAAPLLENLLAQGWTNDYPIIKRLTELAREGGTPQAALDLWFTLAARKRIDELSKGGLRGDVAADARTLLAAKTPRARVADLLRAGYLHFVATKGENDQLAIKLKSEVGDLMGDVPAAQLEAARARFAEQEAAKDRTKVLRYIDSPNSFCESDIPQLVKLFDQHTIGLADFTRIVTALTNHYKWGVKDSGGQRIYSSMVEQLEEQVGQRIDWSGVWDSKHCRSGGIDVLAELQKEWPVDDPALKVMRDQLADLLPIGDDIEPRQIKVLLDSFKREFVDHGYVQKRLEPEDMREQEVISVLFRELQKVLETKVPGLAEAYQQL